MALRSSATWRSSNVAHSGFSPRMAFQSNASGRPRANQN